VVAESFATSVAGVNAHWVRAEKVNVSHVSHKPLASEERTVTNLTLEITFQHVSRLVLYQRCTVDRAELAVAAVVSTLSIRIFWAVKADVLAQIPIEYTTVWTDTLKRKLQRMLIPKQYK